MWKTHMPEKSAPPVTSAPARLTFRVRYVDCDPMGFMHHSHFLPMFEMGRTEMLRQTGIRYRDLEAQNVLFTVTKISVNFKRPARYDDEIELLTRIVRQTHVRIDHSYEMYNIATHELLCTAESTIACITREGQVQPIPDFLKLPLAPPTAAPNASAQP
jgi:acyl-CoA thioester hydrolase